MAAREAITDSAVHLPWPDAAQWLGFMPPSVKVMLRLICTVIIQALFFSDVSSTPKVTDGLITSSCCTAPLKLVEGTSHCFPGLSEILFIRGPCSSLIESAHKTLQTPARLLYVFTATEDDTESTIENLPQNKSHRFFNSGIAEQDTLTGLQSYQLYWTLIFLLLRHFPNN